jgi:hypothetical protein
MANKPDIAPAARVSDEANAPVIFFDNVPVFNNYNGVIGLTLSVNRSLPDNKGGIIHDQVVIAFLRSNIQGAMALRQAIDDAMLLGTKQEGKPN